MPLSPGLEEFAREVYLNMLTVERKGIRDGSPNFLRLIKTRPNDPGWSNAYVGIALERAARDPLIAQNDILRQAKLKTSRFEATLRRLLSSPLLLEGTLKYLSSDLVLHANILTVHLARRYPAEGRLSAERAFFTGLTSDIAKLAAVNEDWRFNPKVLQALHKGASVLRKTSSFLSIRVTDLLKSLDISTAT